MERELVGLLGAGLTSAATGYGIAVPVGAIDSGYTLVDVLSREAGPRIGATLNGMVQALWLEWQRTGLDRDTTALHAGALPAIVELNRPLPEAFAVARSAPDCGRMLAAEVLERARHSGDIARAGLDEGVAYALLERLYHVVLADAAVLPEMMAAIELYLGTNLWQQALSPVASPASGGPPPIPDQTQPHSTAASAQEPQLVSRLSQRALTSVRAGIDALGSRIADPDALANELCTRLTALIERLADLAQRAPDANRHLIGAVRHMSNGEFTQAEQNLIAAQEALIQRASTDLSLARQLMHCAAELLASRAEFEEIRLDLRKAARHYRAATRCLTATDSAMTWQLLTLQAQALLRLDRLQPHDATLTEAARALADALALDARQISAAEWARGQISLADLRCELGRRSGNPNEFIEAANRAREALGIFSNLGAEQEAANTAFAHGQALWQAAERTGDLGLFDSTAQAYRDALQRIQRDQDPIRWVAASSILGQALLRVATLRVEPKLLSAAIEHLRGAVQFASTCNVEIDSVTTEASLGRALLGEYAASGQALLLDLAATAFRRAIKSATTVSSPEIKAGLQHELGMTLWAMAERSNQTSGREAAVETLEASIATFDGIGAKAQAAAVRQDLAKLLGAAPGTGVGTISQHG